MLKVQIPKTPNLPTNDASFRSIKHLMEMNGFSICYYKSNVAFYKSKARIGWEVPITDWYYVSAKEFALVVSLLQKLQDKEVKLNKITNFYKNNA